MRSHLVILALISLFAVLSAEAGTTPMQDLEKATTFMRNLLENDRNAVTKLFNDSKAKLDATAAGLEVKAKTLKVKGDEILAKTAGVDAKLIELNKKKVELEELIKAIQDKQSKMALKVVDNQSSCEAERRSGNMYTDGEAIIYHDIHAALASGIIKKIGNPSAWDSISFLANNKWNGRTLLKLGVGALADGNGVEINVPEGKNVVWIRCANHVWGTFWLSYTTADGKRKNTGVYTCGHRKLNEISPDGGAPDSFHLHHMWMSIPVRQSGKHFIMTGINSDGWISGIAYSTNPWGHASQSAVGIHWCLNTCTAGADWNTENWNNDQLAMFLNQKLYTVSVPVVPNGKSKLLYVVEHDNNWLGTMHTTVKVNGKEVDRFSTSYGNNPFAVHFNAKIYDRYMATLVPADLIPADADFLTVEVDMRKQDHQIHFREMGTHDYN